MAWPQATVVIPCYQAEATVCACLESLLAQDAAFPFEVLVVDNGSSDRSLDLCKAIAERSASMVRLVSEKQPGAYAARNRGIHEARGTLLLFTDADCRAEMAFVRHLVEELQKGDPVIVGGEVVADPDQQNLVARYSKAAKILTQEATLRHPCGPFLQTANLGVRAADARAVGGFNEDLFTGGDADFCYRLRLLYPNRELTLVKNARVFHSHRETIGGLYRQFRRYGHSDVVLAKRYGKCWRYHVARLGVDLVRLVLAPVMSLLYLPWSMLKQDWLFAAAPWFRAVRIVGRRVGQLQAILGHHHRT